MSTEEWQRIAKYPIFPPQPISDDEIRRGIRDTMASMIFVAGAPALFDVGDARAGDLERTMSDAFNRVARRQGYQITHVDMKVESEPIRYQSVLRKIERGQELDLDDVTHLLNGKHDDLDFDAVGRMLRDEFIDERSDDIPEPSGMNDDRGDE